MKPSTTGNAEECLPTGSSNGENNTVIPKPKGRRRTRPEDELKWSLKEKRTVLSTLQRLNKPKLPDCLTQIQRHIPKRSMAEIEQYLAGLVDANSKRFEQRHKTFTESNLKKWIDACDRRTGIDSTCTLQHGESIVAIAHPGLALAGTSIATNSLSSDISKFPCGQELVHGHYEPQVNWNNIQNFMQSLLRGGNPLATWTSTCKWESAILLELIQELDDTVEDGGFEKQHELFFGQHRALKADMLSPPFVDNPMPDDVFGSKLLNPFRLEADMSQCVEKKPV